MEKGLKTFSAKVSHKLLSMINLDAKPSKW